MKNIEYVSMEEGHLAIGEVQYGTVVTNVPGHLSSIYMKVEKRQTGQGVILHWTAGFSVLINIKSGSLRQIPGNTKVRVLEETLQLGIVDDVKPYRKY